MVAGDACPAALRSCKAWRCHLWKYIARTMMERVMPMPHSMYDTCTACGPDLVRHLHSMRNGFSTLSLSRTVNRRGLAQHASLHTAL